MVKVDNRWKELDVKEMEDWQTEYGYYNILLEEPNKRSYQEFLVLVINKYLLLLLIKM